STYLGVTFDKILLRPTSLGLDTVVKTASLKTKRVVKTTKNWKAGLSMRERILVAVGVRILQAIPHKLEKN
ncbi:MAG: hypothetical protein WCD31_11055, partial [Gillisia sp.]